jgi:hypothetical protein
VVCPEHINQKRLSGAERTDFWSGREQLPAEEFFREDAPKGEKNFPFSINK